VQGQRRHVVAEYDLLRRGGIEKIRHGRVRLLQHGIRIAAGAERALVVGVALQQVALDALQARARDLRPGRVVKEHALALQRWKLLPDCFRFQSHAASVI
jgi:hypothetical protein